MNHSINEEILFRKIILNNLRDVSATVGETDSQLTLEQIEQIIQSLHYGFSKPETTGTALKLLISAAPKMRRTSSYYALEKFLDQGIAICQDTNDKGTEADIHIQRGLLHGFQARYLESVESLTKGATLYSEIGDIKKRASSINHLAFIARRQRKFILAKELAQQAQGLINDDNLELEYNHFILGSIAYDMGDGALAEKHFHRSLELCQKSNKTIRIAQRYGNIGLALSQQGRNEEAIVYYDWSLQAYSHIKDPVHEAIMRMNKGVALINLKYPSEALEQFEIAQPILSGARDRLNIAKLFLNFGIATRMLSKWEQSETYLLFSIEQWIELEIISSEINARIELANTYLQQTKYSDAITELMIAENKISKIEDDPTYLSLKNELIEQIRQAKVQPRKIGDKPIRKAHVL